MCVSGRRNVRLVRASDVGWVSVNVNSSVSTWLQSTGHDADRLTLRVVVSDARSRAPLNPFDVFHASQCFQRSPTQLGIREC